LIVKIKYLLFVMLWKSGLATILSLLQTNVNRNGLKILLNFNSCFCPEKNDTIQFNLVF